MRRSRSAILRTDCMLVEHARMLVEHARFRMCLRCGPISCFVAPMFLATSDGDVIGAVWQIEAEGHWPSMSFTMKA